MKNIIRKIKEPTILFRGKALGTLTQLLERHIFPAETLLIIISVMK